MRQEEELSDVQCNKINIDISLRFELDFLAFLPRLAFLLQSQSGLGGGGGWVEALA